MRTRSAAASTSSFTTIWTMFGISKSSQLAAGAGPGEPLGQALAVVLVELGREEDRQPAVGDLGRHGHVLRALGAEEDRQVGPQRVGDRLERLAQVHRALAPQRHLVVLALEVERLLAGEDAADDLDVLPGAGQRLRVRLAVPALDHLRARRAEAEDGPAAGEVVEGERGHRRGGRRAARDLARPRCRAACDLVAAPYQASGVKQSEP